MSFCGVNPAGLFLHVNLLRRCRQIKMQFSYLQFDYPNILCTLDELSRSNFFLGSITPKTITNSDLNRPCFAWHLYGKLGLFKTELVITFSSRTSLQIWELHFYLPTPLTLLWFSGSFQTPQSVKGQPKGPGHFSKKDRYATGIMIGCLLTGTETVGLVALLMYPT